MEKLKQLERLNMIEKVVGALSRKVPKMEGEIQDIKKNSKPSQTKEDVIPSEVVNNKEDKTETVSFNINYIKAGSTSTPKDKKGKVKKSNNEEGLMTCKDCNYKCKKKTSLDKHITIKHEEHPCKECQEKLSSFTELLKHIAKYHCKEQSNI